jgi:hypothetical protein
MLGGRSGEGERIGQRSIRPAAKARAGPSLAGTQSSWILRLLAASCSPSGTGPMGRPWGERFMAGGRALKPTR